MIWNINFFLFSFALSTIWSYMCVYAKHYANVSNVEYGLLAMILPSLSLMAKPVACSIADTYRIHRQLLIAFNIAFAVCFGSLGVLPFFKDPEDHESDSLAWAVIVVLFSVGYASTSCIFCMNDALASNYSRRHAISYGKMRIYANMGWAGGGLVLMLIGNVSWLPFRVPGCILLVVFELADVLFLVFWPHKQDFEMYSGDDKAPAQVTDGRCSKSEIIETSQGGGNKNSSDKVQIALSVSLNLSSSQQQSLDSPPTKVREIQEFVRENGDQTAGRQREYSNFQCQMILMRRIVRDHKSFVRNVVIFVLYGIVQSMIWNFQLDYFKQKIAPDEQTFEYMATLSMIAQSVGEVLINVWSRQIIKVLGHDASLSLALVSLGLRCCVYSNLLPYVNVNWVILAELLQGPSLGAYWVLIVEIGSKYALMVVDYLPEMRRQGIIKDQTQEDQLRNCLRATMIGVMSSSMEGLGVAVGSITGGVISTRLGYENMWNLCAVVCISVGLLGSLGLLRKLAPGGDRKVHDPPVSSPLAVE